MSDTSVIELSITGMHCAGCSGRIEKALTAIDGVQTATVNLTTENARVHVADAPINAKKLIDAIEAIGFGAEPYKQHSKLEDDQHDAGRSKRDRHMAFFAIGLSLPMILQMVWMWLGNPAVISPWQQFTLAFPVQFIAGARFYRPAWFAARDLTGNMDLLVVTGTLAAFGLSMVSLINGQGELYFEASASVIALVLLGKWMESRAKRSATTALRSLMGLRPDTAIVLRCGIETQIPTLEINIDDVFIVRPGERIPTDGEIIKGTASLDEAMVTGESLPVIRSVGDLVTGGVANTDGLLEIKATAIGHDTVLARIIHIVDQAQSDKAPIQRFVDRVAQVFVPIVLFIALATFAGWLMTGAEASQALINAVSVLVVACPCALGLATPTAITVGTGIAARNGILIRDVSALEIAHNITTVVFDKTGTLTEGKPIVSSLKTLPGVSESEMLGLAASVQADSRHPLAIAVASHAKEQGIETFRTTAFTSATGKGVSATIDGLEVHVGNRRYLSEQGVSVPDSVIDEDNASTQVWIAKDLDLMGCIYLSDHIRDSAHLAISTLKNRHITPVLLSGDNQNIAKQVATELGIEKVLAEVLPDQKAATIKSLQADQKGIIAMVGDGINDAPALAQADVGIAMGSGSDIAMDTAAITLMQSSPLRVVDAIDLSKATYQKIKQNLFWAFVYNVIALPLAALGYMSPVIAGAAMAMSSVSVVSNSLLLRRWKSIQGKPS